MNIITLTTDMGQKDHYVASLKGKIFSLFETARIIDITHDIKPFNILQAAFVLRNCLADFPENSVHVIGVDPEPLVNFTNPDESILPTIMKFKNQYFVGNDNGVFSLILENNNWQELWVLEEMLSQPEIMKFPTKNILVPAACKLAQGIDPIKIAEPKTTITRRISPSPVIESNVLKGIVSHIDHYGNIISNIKHEDFNRMGKNTPFIIYFRQKEYYIDEISLGYNEVPAGEKVAIFNDAGFLEIAINKGTPENGGGASALFGLRLGDIIRIEFTPRGSHQTIDSLF